MGNGKWEIGKGKSEMGSGKSTSFALGGFGGQWKLALKAERPQGVESFRVGNRKLEVGSGPIWPAFYKYILLIGGRIFEASIFPLFLPETRPEQVLF
jgi:hypothetical protein